MARSVVKKVIMSLSGLFLISFLTVHMAANLCVLWGEPVYTAVCDFMGTNPFVKTMVPVLAAGFVIHIVYAFILGVHNLRASRHSMVRYQSGNRSRTAESVWGSWAARNMLVLGIIVLGLLAFHLSQFWAQMQWREFTGGTPMNGYTLVTTQFARPGVAIAYLIWLTALWFHLNHGFWSAFQSIGLSTPKLLPWMRIASLAVSTVLCGGFATVVIYCL